MDLLYNNCLCIHPLLNFSSSNSSGKDLGQLEDSRASRHLENLEAFENVWFFYFFVSLVWEISRCGWVSSGFMFHTPPTIWFSKGTQLSLGLESEALVQGACLFPSSAAWNPDSRLGHPRLPFRAAGRTTCSLAARSAGLGAPRPRSSPRVSSQRLSWGTLYPVIRIILCGSALCRPGTVVSSR